MATAHEGGVVTPHVASWKTGPGWIAPVAVAIVAIVLLVWLAWRKRTGGRRHRPGPSTLARDTVDPMARPRCAWPGSSPPREGSRDAEVLALFGDLRPGEKLARWTLAWIGSECEGRVRVGFIDADGVPFEVELRRLAPGGPVPPGAAGETGVFLVGVPRGSATHEEHGLGAMALASWLDDVGAPTPAWLRPGPRSGEP